VIEKSSLLDLSAGYKISGRPDVLVVGKYSNVSPAHKAVGESIVAVTTKLKSAGVRVLVDYTDHHLGGFKWERSKSDALNKLNSEGSRVTRGFYERILTLCNGAVVSSEALAAALREHFPGPIWVIPEACEFFADKPPSEDCGAGTVSEDDRSSVRKPRGLYYGTPYSFAMLLNALPILDGYCGSVVELVCLVRKINLDYVASGDIYIPSLKNVKLDLKIWSPALLLEEAKNADFVFIPGDPEHPHKRYISANRLIQGFALGLPVVATRMLSYQPYERFFTVFPSAEAEAFFSDFAVQKGQLAAAWDVAQGYREDVVMRLWEDLFTDFLGAKRDRNA